MVLSGVAQAKSLEAQIGSFAENAENMAIKWQEIEEWMKIHKSEYKEQGMMVEFLKVDVRLVMILHICLLDKFSNEYFLFMTRNTTTL